MGHLHTPILVSDQDPVIRPLVKYVKNGTFGLDVPEQVVREVYIMQPDLSPVVGWETGRNSEPAFMDMNLHSTREVGEAAVCVMQWDLSDPLNSAGLLVAYAEQRVLPVVSDFDTLLVGSEGSFQYKEPIPNAQVNLVRWALKHCEAIMVKQAETADDVDWTHQWLDILAEAAYQGFKPEIPEMGFGDLTSLKLTFDMVQQTSACGAIRHGAECFNYYFPQELDEEFLVVWEGLEARHGAPWLQHSELELRQFLLERIADGYLFPINPIWPVRDKGWYEVFVALRNAPGADKVLPIWYPDDIIQIIDRLHAAYPRCLVQAPPNSRSMSSNGFSRCSSDLTADEIVNLRIHELERRAKARWCALRACVYVSGKGPSFGVQVCVGVGMCLLSERCARRSDSDVAETCLGLKIWRAYSLP